MYRLTLKYVLTYLICRFILKVRQQKVHLQISTEFQSDYLYPPYIYTTAKLRHNLQMQNCVTSILDYKQKDISETFKWSSISRIYTLSVPPSCFQALLSMLKSSEILQNANRTPYNTGTVLSSSTLNELIHFRDFNGNKILKE